MVVLVLLDDGGPLPGYAASHGCVRMPYDFAEKLFDKTWIGMRVIISPNDAAQVEISPPGAIRAERGGRRGCSGACQTLAREPAADRSGTFGRSRSTAGRRLDALLPDEAVGKALHRGRWRIRCGAVATCSTKQGWPSSRSAVLQLANDSLGDIAHGINRADHLLLANNHIVEQAFELRRHPRIDQGRVGLFENTEQRQAGLGRHDVLSLGNQETLFFSPPMISARDLGELLLRRRWSELLISTLNGK